MTKTQYARYLKSDHWSEVKDQYVKSGRPRCCILCVSKKYALHHVSYDNLGHESLDDLIPLCEKHHNKLHKIHSKERIPLSDFATAATFLGYSREVIGLKLSKYYNPNNETTVIVIDKVSVEETVPARPNAVKAIGIWRGQTQVHWRIRQRNQKRLKEEKRKSLPSTHNLTKMAGIIKDANGRRPGDDVPGKKPW